MNSVHIETLKQSGVVLQIEEARINFGFGDSPSLTLRR
jgi:hypothetical protein